MKAPELRARKVITDHDFREAEMQADRILQLSNDTGFAKASLSHLHERAGIAQGRPIDTGMMESNGEELVTLCVKGCRMHRPRPEATAIKTTRTEDPLAPILDSPARYGVTALPNNKRNLRRHHPALPLVPNR